MAATSSGSLSKSEILPLYLVGGGAGVGMAVGGTRKCVYYLSSICRNKIISCPECSAVLKIFRNINHAFMGNKGKGKFMHACNNIP